MKEYEDSIIMKKSDSEYYNEDPIQIEFLEDLLSDLCRRPRIYFHGVGYKIETDGRGRVAQIHYSLPGIEARELYDSLRSYGINIGMTCRNSWVESLEARYSRSEMGPYLGEGY